MAESPIRVVVFTSGAVLEYGVKAFIQRLEDEPQIDLVGVFCQAPEQGLGFVVRDLWRRRRWLAGPLLVALGLDMGLRWITRPAAMWSLNRTMKDIHDRLHVIPDIHAPEVLAQIEILSPALGLIYGSPILKPALFEIPLHGTLGIHHGKLPAYRGKKTMFWAMYNGEPTVGVTIQKVNAGLDTGEIAYEGEVPVKRGTRWAVWHDLEQLGFDLYIRAILDVQAGNAVYKPFPGKKGKLYRDPSLRDLMRFWLGRRA